MTKHSSSTQSGTPPIKNNETKKQRKGAVTAEQIADEDPFVSMDIAYLKSPSDLADVENNPLQRIPRKDNTQSTASSTSLPPQSNALPLSVLPPDDAPQLIQAHLPPIAPQTLVVPVIYTPVNYTKHSHTYQYLLDIEDCSSKDNLCSRAELL